MARLRMSEPQLELLSVVAEGRATRIHPMGQLPVVESDDGTRYRWDTYHALVKKGLVEEPPSSFRVNWQPVVLRITDLGREILAKGQ